MEKEEFALMKKTEQTHWWFAGKRFLIREILARYASDGRRKTVLDIGCGTGMLLDMLTSMGAIYGFDASSEALVLSRKRGLKRLVCADANWPLPVKNGVCDVIMALDVLEHLDKDGAAVREIYRICAPGGLVIITVPAFQIHWSPHDVALHHRRRYKKRQLEMLISGMDWQVLKSTYYNTTLFFPILAIRKIRALSARGEQIPISDFDLSIPSFFNRALATIFKAEIAWLRIGHLPFGVSLLAVLQKPYE